MVPHEPKTEVEWLASVRHYAYTYIEVPEEIKTVEMALIAVKVSLILLRIVPDEHLKAVKAGMKLLGIRSKENGK